MLARDVKDGDQIQIGSGKAAVRIIVRKRGRRTRLVVNGPRRHRITHKRGGKVKRK